MRPIVSTNTLLAVAVSFVIGLLIGWMALGWFIAPVNWVDAGPANLRQDLQVEYVQMAADSLALTGNADKATQRLAEFGDDAGPAMQTALTAITDPFERVRVEQLIPLVPAAGGQPAAAGGIPWLQILGVCFGGLFIIVVAGGAFFFLRSRSSTPATKAAGRPATSGFAPSPGSTAQMVQPEIAYPAGEEPISTFKTTYMLGNDLYDESFSIDDQQGDFLGECGVGIGETMGVGDPKKVAAFEVWLFDKNDIRTVTKVVMSDHAFRDETLKSKLAAKGEPVLARSGEVVKMETATLKVEARIVDLQYGSGPLPSNSFFQQLTLEISAWKKAA